MKTRNNMVLFLLVLQVFCLCATMFGWEALTFEESRTRTMNKLSEISTKYASTDAELSQKAAAVVSGNSIAAKNTDWLQNSLDFVGYSLQRYPARKGTDAIRKDLLWVLDSVLNTDN